MMFLEDFFLSMWICLFCVCVCVFIFVQFIHLLFLKIFYICTYSKGVCADISTPVSPLMVSISGSREHAETAIFTCPHPVKTKFEVSTQMCAVKRVKKTIGNKLVSA